MNDIWFFICNFTRTLTITHPPSNRKARNLVKDLPRGNKKNNINAF